MPYWSSSRVGAVPQPPANKQKKRTERYNRKNKGITMEDLKKQTAIRLAHEQQQQQGIHGNPPGNIGFVPPQDRPGVVQTQARRPFHTAESNHPHIPFQPQQQEQHVPIVPPPPVDDPYYLHHQRYDQNSHQHAAGMSHHSIENDHTAVTPVKQVPVRSFHPPEHQRSAPRPTKSSSSENSNAKAKLPHGLTVHELKAMTKARLQAEASDTSETLVPSIVRASPEFREAHAPSPTYRELHAPSPTYREAHAPSPTLSSPGFPGRSARSPFPEQRSPFPDTSYPPPQLESWSHDSRNEVWENGSVSTQTSDYIGSEHPFASFNNGEENSFHRVGSFPSAAPPRDIHSPSMGQSQSSGFYDNRASPFPTPSRDIASPSMGQSQSSGYYDNGFVPNRRRAATLSPRVGLSHLHEDRPFVPAQELPALPAFQPMSYTPGVIGMTDQGNRTRTLSAVSLPAMSHTAEDFAPEDPPAVTGLSDVFREDRTRASTWGPDLFGPGLLADDLASILKLTEENH